MLNLSETRMPDLSFFSKFKSTEILKQKTRYRLFSKILLGTAIVMLIALFLPWTQTIPGRGYVTTLQPEHRPQTLQSPIPGQIAEWYVNEGDFVNKGDTILHIAEVENEYFDPKLLDRTREQIVSKQGAVLSYEQKVLALQNKLQALRQERILKLEQARNKIRQAQLKIESDSISLQAARINADIADVQYERNVILTDQGLRSRLDLEGRKNKQQDALAKAISLENKLLASRNELINARIEINRLRADYENKISSIQSDISTAESTQFDTRAQVTKLENSFSNYEIRRDLYYIRAPQDGFINKAIKTGIGETFSQGEKLVNIVPANSQLAVETYVDPVDLPLIKLGDHVRIKFDGWPSIVFSGWPNASVGTFGGKVVVIENFMSTNGKYRVLLTSEETRFNEGWPEALRIGAGAYTLALLEDVPIWYEIWRRINGFPPNFYPASNESSTATTKASKSKKK